MVIRSKGLEINFSLLLFFLNQTGQDWSAADKSENLIFWHVGFSAN